MHLIACSSMIPRSNPLSLLITLLLPALVSGHGYVATVTVDGTTYKGNAPQADPTPAVIRQISDVSPVKGASNPDLTCGQSAQPASDVAQANPGDQITFAWKGGDGSDWPHNTGPMLTYMASCGDETCDKFDQTQAKWFKIQQVGRKSDRVNWAQADLMDGASALVTIPSTLAPGNYLIRHEIVALHLATSMGGAEFYPSCTQLTVGGSGTGAPTSDELVSLPGAYSDDDPGIFDPDVYDTSAGYTFPGPPIAAFVGGLRTLVDPNSGDGEGDGDNGSGSGSGSNSSAAAGSGTGTRTAAATRTSATATGTSAPGYTPPSKCSLRRPTNVLLVQRRSTEGHFGTRLRRRLGGLGLGLWKS